MFLLQETELPVAVVVFRGKEENAVVETGALGTETAVKIFADTPLVEE